MLVNVNNLKKSEINSFAHKVRAYILDENNKIFITDMNSSYNLPGGRVKNGEDIKNALKRELLEELGINISDNALDYKGQIIFYHCQFPDEKGFCNRENKVDLFVVNGHYHLNANEIKLTNYEKHYNFKMLFCSVKDINKLLAEKNMNLYKKFTDLELKTLINIIKGEI